MASLPGSIRFAFKVLVWLFAEDGDKASEFAVLVDGGQVHGGLAKIDNTSGRTGNLLERGKLGWPYCQEILECC